MSLFDRLLALSRRVDDMADPDSATYDDADRPVTVEQEDAARRARNQRRSDEI